MDDWRSQLIAEFGLETEEEILTATAPYNFVSLPKKALSSEIDGVENFKKHILENGKISGEIELEFETLTPIFIGGNPNDTTITFSPTGKPIIAGSTIRGMFKNILKIVTCGAFRGRTDSQRKGEDFNDEHVYYRCIMGVGALAWTKDLNKVYNARMVGEIRGKDGKMKPAKNARPGFLIQMTNGKFFIAPSIYEHDRKVDRLTIYDKIFRNLKESCVIWDKDTAYIFTGKGGRKKFVRFTKLDYVDWSREHWVELPDEVRESYEHDRNRRGVNLFTDDGILTGKEVERLTKKSLPDIKTLIPCHFLYEKNQVTAFGHGQYFRIPYKKSVGDLVPAVLKSQSLVDFADAIFGKEKFWASRVFFEDAKIISTIKTLPKIETHPLMQPNPTSYQLYLTQGDGKLKHWDSDGAKLRGYKLYWHNENEDWQADDYEKTEKLKRLAKGEDPLTKTLKPLAKGNRFKSKIRFQNLSAVELGALLMIFNLNGAKNPAYKIGQGKPLGFGSVKVKSKLFIENDDAYENIFDGNGWKNPYGATNPKKYLDAFKKYVAAQKMTAIWEEVLKELNLILDWDKKPSPKKIKAMGNTPDEKGNMQLDERLRQREILPTIFEVMK